ncbi:MAG: HAD-IB family hydrolase [Acidimicrobiia bacterium]
MGREAVFFDLDRTLLRGASGPVIGEALREVGLLRRRVPGESLVYRTYDLFGESRATMAATRAAARLARGWSADKAQEAGRLAAEALSAAVQPMARPIIAEHHAAGRPVVLATTTPYDMVRPLAQAVGLDDVIATRYGVGDGAYDGTIDGHFVWGKGKLKAVNEWAAAHGVSVADSWAYSDSVYDIPLLSAVAHPHAVNPDLRLLAQAKLRRWPVLHLDAPPGVPKLFGVEPQQAMLTAAHPVFVPYARFDITGAANIPEAGPAIVCANHRSYFDFLAIGMALAERGRPVRFLGKRELFDAPVVGQLVRALGGIPVDRGSGSDSPLKAAAAALDAGQLVVVMPQGTIPRGHDFFEPTLKGRKGAARLAAMTGAPIVPVGMWGTEKVWPRSARVPSVWNVLRPPPVTIQVGEAFDLDGEDLVADTEAIMAAIVDLLPPVARRRRRPTSSELARTFPPGHS